MTTNKTSRRDPNSVVTVGMRVNGQITKKMEDFVVVAFDVGKSHCSGVLHVSEFPSLDRAERTAMFGVAEVGMPAPGLVVIGVTPPAEGKFFTKVRLSALKDLKDAQPAEERNEKKDSGKPAGKKHHRKHGNKGKPHHKGGKASGDSGARKRHHASAPQGTGGNGAPKQATAEGDAPATVKATAATPSAEAPPKAVHDTPAGQPKEAKKKEGTGETKAAQPTITAPADPIDAARKLVASVRTPADSVSDFAEIGRMLRLKEAAGDVGFMARIRTIEEGLARLDECGDECQAIVRTVDAKVLTAAAKVASARVQGTLLDQEASAIKQESARYAGLCKRAGSDESNEALQSEKSAAKSKLDSRREKLAADREANKKALDDADLELVFAISAGAGSEEYEAPVAAAEKLAKLKAEIAEKTTWIGRMVLRCERHLAPPQT